MAEAVADPTSRPVHAIPTMGGLSPWLALFVVPWVAVRLVDAVSDPSPGNLVIEALAVFWGFVAAVSLTNHRPWSATWDGEVVEVRGRWTTTRFRLADLVWVIDPVMAVTGPVRVRRVERRLFGIPVPHPWPWTAVVSTQVHPSFWVRHLGVPEERVRGGGLAFRRRGLRGAGS